MAGGFRVTFRRVADNCCVATYLWASLAEKIQENADRRRARGDLLAYFARAGAACE